MHIPGVPVALWVFQNPAGCWEANPQGNQSEEVLFWKQISLDSSPSEGCGCRAAREWCADGVSVSPAQEGLLSLSTCVKVIISSLSELRIMAFPSSWRETGDVNGVPSDMHQNFWNLSWGQDADAQLKCHWGRALREQCHRWDVLWYSSCSPQPHLHWLGLYQMNKLLLLCPSCWCCCFVVRFWQCLIRLSWGKKS